MASTTSTLHVKRLKSKVKTAFRDTRDLDGNKVSDEPSEQYTYKYNTGDIPSAGLEEVCRLMATDDINNAFMYHARMQGNL